MLTRGSKHASVKMRQWLSMRHILKTMDNNILSNCYDDIIESFDDKKDILSACIKNATMDQISQVINIFAADKNNMISTILHQNLPLPQIKNVTKILNDIQNQIPEQNSIAKNSHTSYFDYISKESIFNICEFLDKNSIAAFKLSSMCNALIVLEMMQCYRIGVFNLNESIGNCNFNNCIKINRIKPFTKLRSLIITYCNRYNIARGNLIMIKSASLLTRGKPHSTDNWTGQILDLSQDVDNITNNSIFCVFDKTKIISFNDNQKVHKLNKRTHLVLLQYFDIEQQKIKNLQLFTCNKPKITMEQLLNHACNDKYESWNHRIVQQLNEMREQITDSKKLEPLIQIYLKRKNCLHKLFRKERANKPAEIVFTPPILSVGLTGITVDTIVFQMTYSHYYHIDYDRTLEKDNKQPFYEYVTRYIKDQQDRYQILIKYDDYNFHEVKYFDEEYKFKSSEDILHVTPQTTYLMIKYQISAKFSYKLPLGCIELYDENHIKYEDTYIGVIGRQRNFVLYWRLVHYDTRTANRENNNMFKITIFDPTKNEKQLFVIPPPKFKVIVNTNKPIGTHGVNFKPHVGLDSKRGYNLYFHQISFLHAYSNKSVEELRFDDENSGNSTPSLHVNEFLENMMASLSHDMYKEKYQSIIRKYKDKHKYSFLLMNDEDYECYDNNDEFKACWKSDFCNCNVMIVKNQSISVDDCKESDTIPVIVRFGLIFNELQEEQTESCSTGIGYPMKIFITKETLLQHVLDHILEDNNEYVFESCLSKKGNVAMHDNIYGKLYNDNATKRISVDTLLILFDRPK